VKTISLRVQPRASSDRIQKIADGEYKIYTVKPAGDNKANLRVIEILAEYLGVKKNRIHILKGHKSKDKLIKITEQT